MTNAHVRMLREYRADPEAGWTHEELAVLFGISPARSSEICRGLAYKDAGGPIDTKYSRKTGAARPGSPRRSTPRPGARGELSVNAKMTNEAVEQMRILRSQYWPYGKLAEKFGISTNRAWEICTGLAYKDAGGPLAISRQRK